MPCVFRNDEGRIETYLSHEEPGAEVVALDNPEVQAFLEGREWPEPQPFEPSANE